jgi:hypothetical protein
LVVHVGGVVHVEHVGRVGRAWLFG